MQKIVIVVSAIWAMTTYEVLANCRASRRAEDNLLICWRPKEIAERCKTMGLICGRDYFSFYHCF